MAAVRTTAPAHYVRHNKATRIPRNFIYFDSEAYREIRKSGEVQTFRVAVARQDRRRHDHDQWVDGQPVTFESPDDLWAWIDARTQRRARTVCVAHNLAYDLRICRAFDVLPGLGWSLKAVRLDRGSAWCSWRREDRTLMLVDSFSWLPVSLDRIGEACEVAKLPLPAWDDTDAAWEARCTRDVTILAVAYRRLMDWVRDDDLGNWKPTGAGQAWAAYRHRFMDHRVLAHDDDDARLAERRAAWTGRCEVWQHGRPRHGPFSEWDFSTAYGRVSVECEVPTKLVGSSSSATLAQLETLSRKFAVLAEVEVTTNVPTTPCERDGRIVWPIGTFKTVVWDTEMELSLRSADRVVVSRLWWYRRAPAVRSFARWAVGLCSPGGTEPDPVVVLAAKHWSRALVGRFGGRWSDWATVGRSATSDVALQTVIDRTDNSRWQLLQVGHELKRRSELFDSPDSVVAIMSWIMAECRVRLWRLCETAGLEHVVYMDTDGIVVNRHGHEALVAAEVPGLRLKGSYGTCELLGPRQIRLGGKLRASGVPARSVKVGERTYEGEVWTELATSLRAGTSGQVEVTRRRITLAGTDTRREHQADGATVPFTVLTSQP